MINQSASSLDKFRKVPIDSLSLDPANTRKHGERNMDAIKGSLAQFGQVEPLVVQKGTGRIIGGNGRFSAMKTLGFTEVAIYEVELDATQAAALGIALNRTAELAEWDEHILGTLLGGLQDTPIDMTTLGFTDQEISNLMAKLDPPAPKPDSEGFGERQMVSFVVNAEQADVIKLAMDRVRRAFNDKTMSDGDALEHVATGYLDSPE